MFIDFSEPNDFQESDEMISVSTDQNEHQDALAELEKARKEIEDFHLQAEKTKEETKKKQFEQYKMKAELDIRNARMEADRLRNELEMHIAHSQLTQASMTFGLARFSNNKELIKFYTGFNSYNHIVQFYKFIEPNAQIMQYCYASGAGESALKNVVCQ